MTIARFRLQIVQILARRLHEGKMALFLGAGIGMGIGLPSWPRLIKNLYWTRRKRPPTGKDLAHAAELFLRNECHGRYREYVSAVRQALYQGITFDFARLHGSITLAAVCALAMSSRRGNAKVFTLNYDDSVERYLSYHGYVCRPVFQERDASTSADVHVFHPHGFLPSPGSPYTTASDKIILDKLSYSRTLGEIDNWWSRQMQSVMESHCCVFVGLSTQDQRLDVLLVNAHGRHDLATERVPYWGASLIARPSLDVKGDWESRGICAHNVGDYKLGLGDFLFGIAQRAAQARLIVV
jgi:hypothetical protein